MDKRLVCFQVPQCQWRVVQFPRMACAQYCQLFMKKFLFYKSGLGNTWLIQVIFNDWLFKAEVTYLKKTKFKWTHEQTLDEWTSFFGGWLAVETNFCSYSSIGSFNCIGLCKGRSGGGRGRTGGKIDGLALVVVHTYTILTWTSTVFFCFLAPKRIFGLLSKVGFLMMKTNFRYIYVYVSQLLNSSPSVLFTIFLVKILYWLFINVFPSFR